jgi:hypothetical protein
MSDIFIINFTLYLTILVINLSSLHEEVNLCILIPFLLILSSRTHHPSISFSLSCRNKIIPAILDIVAIISIVKLSLLFIIYSFKRRRKMLFIKIHSNYLLLNFMDLETTIFLKFNLTYFQFTFADLVSTKTSFCLDLKILNEHSSFQ